MTDSAAVAVKEFIVANFLTDTTPEQLDSDYELLATGAIDSLGLLKLISWLEEHFEVPIDDVEIAPENFRSVSAVCRFIDEASAAIRSGA